MFGRESIDYVVQQAAKAAPGGDWITVNPHIVVEMGSRLTDLEATLRDALDHIDNPTDIPGPTLIVLAGRRLLEKK